MELESRIHDDASEEDKTIFTGLTDLLKIKNPLSGTDIDVVSMEVIHTGIAGSTDTAAISGGISKETAAPIDLQSVYTYTYEDNSPRERWYTFKTSSNPSEYFFCVNRHSSSGSMDYIIYDTDHKQIVYDSVSYDENYALGFTLQPDTVYWIYVDNFLQCDYTFSMKEYLRDGGLTRTEALPIDLDTRYDKVIEIPQLPDWYSITTTANQSVYRFALDKNVSESVISYDLYLTLYDADGIMIREISSSNNNIGFMDIILSPETQYYIRINGLNYETSIGDYAFKVSERICDAGTSSETASELKIGSRHTGQINSTLSDWYKYEITETGTYTLAVHNIDTGEKISCNLYKNEVSSSITSFSADNEESRSATFSAAAGDTVYLQIFSEKYAANRTYIFEINMEEG